MHTDLWNSINHSWLHLYEEHVGTLNAFITFNVGMSQQNIKINKVTASPNQN